MHIPIESDEQAKETLEKMPLKVFFRDLDYDKRYRYRRVYMISCDHGHYELLVYRKSSLFPNGHIQLRCHSKGYARLGTTRNIYEGPLSKQSWAKMISYLADNFVEVY
jgi:hypothetical protein